MEELCATASACGCLDHRDEALWAACIEVRSCRRLPQGCRGIQPFALVVEQKADAIGEVRGAYLVVESCLLAPARSEVHVERHPVPGKVVCHGQQRRDA